MNSTAVTRCALFVVVIGTLGCQEFRPATPTAASLFIPSLEGVWAGPMTLDKTSGGECVQEVIDSFLPTLDQGTLTVTQSGADVLATFTMESVGLACRYVGSASVSSLALNASACDRTGLIVACRGGVSRELQLVGSSVTAIWNGDRVTGQVSSTYNVFTPPEGLQLGVGSLIATHSFTATRR